MQDSDGDMRYWLPPVRDGKPEVLTAARKRRKDVMIVEGERGGTDRKSLVRPLDMYVAQSRITGPQYQAGNRFYALWHYSILHARFVRMPFGEQGGGEVDLEAQALAPREYLAASKAIRGVFERRTVFRVCCEDDYAGRRRNMAALVAGLDDLANHFRIKDA